MIRNMLFVFLLIPSCNGFSRSTVCNMDGQGSSEEGQALDAYIFLKEDEFEDAYVFNDIALSRCQLWYSSVMLDSENPETVILDLYNWVDQYSQLPFIGTLGKLAVDKLQKVWKQGKQVFGKVDEIFGKDSDALVLIRASCRKIPELRKQACLNMVLELVDMLFQIRPQKYGELVERLTELEQSISTEVKKGNPSYNEELAYLKKLLMEHFNELNKDTFYSKFYAGHIVYLQNIHALLPLVVCAGTSAVKNGFVNFLKNRGKKIEFEWLC
ncbi:hypothetical protein [Cardinium endosymbiont of Philonthus spinipes]|uniref:hypothetical protein n=1 Tax=Cardinium endosymbiont of Philonthus spinipes TaxID=3077941 RepID=UPI00313D7B5E